MSDRQHVTTRRAFIATLGFGGVALYGAWAAYGAAPLPFLRSSALENDAGMPMPQASEGHGGGHGGGGAMTSEDFLREHEEFMARFRQPDGSVAVGPGKTTSAHAMPQMPTGHDMHAMPQMSAAGDDMPAIPRMPGAGHDISAMLQPPAMGHGEHGAVQRDAGDTGQMHAPSQGDAMADSHAAEQPTDLYLLAYRFGFTPDDIRLESGKPYRFRMMASDITHGASLQLGRGSRIIRLRPNVVTEQTITFRRPGPVLVYCTTFCGPAHDAMKARILVT